MDQKLISKERAIEFDIKVAGEEKEEELGEKIEQLKQSELAEKKQIEALLAQ